MIEFLMFLITLFATGAAVMGYLGTTVQLFAVGFLVFGFIILVLANS